MALKTLLNRKFLLYPKLFNRLKNIHYPRKKITSATSQNNQLKLFCTCCSPPMPTEGRHCFHAETECLMNQQILAELNASIAYLSMACFFGRTDVALPGSEGFFLNMYREEQEHSMIFINYQLMRGGHIKLYPITVPECQDWQCVKKALCVSLEMEKMIKEKLATLYESADKHQDLQTMDLISTKFMEEQNKSICEIARLLTMAKKMTEGTGDFLFDREVMYKAFVKKTANDKKYK